MDTPLSTTFKSALNLAIFAILGTAALALVFNLTKENIAKNEEQAKLKLIGQILPAEAYDNAILTDTLELPPTPELGTSSPTPVYRARKGGEPAAVVLEVVAPDGYAGAIKMIVSIYASGELGGVRVIAHKETPGLGDYIEIGRSKWITQFDGQSLAKLPAPENWKVKKDGGVFDYNSGATVTPRAVVKAVHKAVRYFDANRDQLFAPSIPAGETK